MPPRWAGERAALLLRRIARMGLRTPLDTEVWGLNLRLFPVGNLAEARILFMPQQWDWQERELLALRARPGFVFVDVGANAGGYSWWMHHVLGEDATIIAIEPDPQIVAGLAANVARNSCTNLHVVPAAVGASAGQGTLFVRSANLGESSLERTDASDSEIVRTETVSVRTLAAVLEAEGVTRVDALKIDIEGMELPVVEAFFEEAPEDLWPTLIITEFKDTERHRGLHELLERNGYGPLLRTKLNLVMERRPGGSG
jgi:FkbM family methyltransferase